ncbi:MAG: nucleoside permease [Opitutaceae bacterium]|jgi:NHS family xanthosine MFS transporter
MSVKSRLIILNFTQFFVWGAWLISLGGYMIATLRFTGGEVGSIYSTMGLASLFMPGLLGIVADRWINAERVLGLCHIAGALLLFLASTIRDPAVMYWVMLLNSMVYMPTIALNNSVSYGVLSSAGFDVVKHFPPIRVWGTVGFIAAMWVVDLIGWSVSPMQLYIASISSLALGVYSFTLPACPPSGAKKSASFASAFGLDAFVLFRNRQMAVFFVFAAFIGAALQITNTFGEAFLHDFKGAYANSFAVVHPGLLMSVSQISETLFILTIPFFLGRFGIKRIMMISICAWVLRFGLFGVGNPGGGLILLVLSMIIYGMAFDFYNISGSLFVELEAEPRIRASAQGLFMIMTNGLGALIGGVASGRVVDYFTVGGVKDWRGIWFVFAAYALVLGLIFPFAFRYDHDRRKAALREAAG